MSPRWQSFHPQPAGATGGGQVGKRPAARLLLLLFLVLILVELVLLLVVLVELLVFVLVLVVEILVLVELVLLVLPFAAEAEGGAGRRNGGQVGMAGSAGQQDGVRHACSSDSFEQDAGAARARTRAKPGRTSARPSTSRGRSQPAGRSRTCSGSAIRGGSPLGATPDGRFRSVKKRPAARHRPAAAAAGAGCVPGRILRGARGGLPPRPGPSALRVGRDDHAAALAPQPLAGSLRRGLAQAG